MEEVLRLQAEQEPHHAACGLNRTTSSMGSVCL